MLERIDQALCGMQAALTARKLYGADHPAAAKAESEALQALNIILQETPAIQVIAVDHRVIAQGLTLSSSVILSSGLFARLRDFGFDGLLFRRGLKREEVTALLTHLAPNATGETLPTFPGLAPVRIDECRTSPTASLTARPDRAAQARAMQPRAGAAAMAPMMTRIVQEGVLDDDALGNVVSNINAVVNGAENTIIPLASLKQHDEYTYVHTINVGLLAAALAEAVGMAGDRLFELTSAALLHDVGKRLIPRVVLNKPGQLSDEELKLVRSHPEQGARLLLSVPNMSPIVPIVAYEHHMERGGGGYPSAPHGWRMHLASQIVQIADVFDALRTHRPYREAMTLPQAREIMDKDAGARYDAELLRIFFDRVSVNTDRELADELISRPAARAA